MICKSEEASQYKCCVMNKQCEGDKCMAWVELTKIIENENPNIPLKSFTPIKKEKNDLGKCGRVKND